MNRAHWQVLAEERVVAAHALLAVQQWSSAYYLAGYAVEFGLKSCILVHVENTGIIFEKKDFSEKCWTHGIKDLLKLAGLEAARGIDIAANPVLDKNWGIVMQWTEKSRYERKTQSDAEGLCHAIIEPVNGVLPWIRARW